MSGWREETSSSERWGEGLRWKEVPTDHDCGRRRSRCSTSDSSTSARPPHSRLRRVLPIIASSSSTSTCRLHPRLPIQSARNSPIHSNPPSSVSVRPRPRLPSTHPSTPLPYHPYPPHTRIYIHFGVDHCESPCPLTSSLVRLAFTVTLSVRLIAMPYYCLVADLAAGIARS